MTSHLEQERKKNQMGVIVNQYSLENLSNDELIQIAYWLVDQEEPINKTAFKEMIVVLAERLDVEID